MNPITQDTIKAILKKINYPGFQRDIVSFGMLEKVIIEKNLISVYLQIKTDNKENLTLLEQNIINEIKRTYQANVKVIYGSKENTHISNNKSKITNVAHTIAIASGKGGVGKSTIAVNLAASLSKKYNVGILDLDIYGPSLPMLVNENSQPQITSNKKLLPLKKYNMQLMSFGFINNENAPAIWRGPMVARMTQQFINDVEWDNLDYLILDLPPGTGDIQLTLVQSLALSGAIIVTTPQKLALLDVKKGADMFNKVNTPVIGVIENMTHFMCPSCNEKTKIFPGESGQEESTRLDVPLLGKIALTPEIVTSTEEGKPYTMEYKSKITTDFENITSQIIDFTKIKNSATV